MGEWTQYGNPCQGRGGETNFDSQDTYGLPVNGKSNSFIFMTDRWNKLNPEDSGYLWLPMHIEEGRVHIRYVDLLIISIHELRI